MISKVHRPLNTVLSPCNAISFSTFVNYRKVNTTIGTDLCSTVIIRGVGYTKSPRKTTENNHTHNKKKSRDFKPLNKFPTWILDKQEKEREEKKKLAEEKDAKEEKERIRAQNLAKKEQARREKENERKAQELKSVDSDSISDDSNPNQSEESLLQNIPEELVVSRDENDMRLDRFVHKRLPQLPNSLIQKLIRNKKIVLRDDTPRNTPEEEESEEGEISKIKTIKVAANDRVKTRQTFIIKTKKIKLNVEREEKQVELTEKEIETIRSYVIYKDDDIIAINKPSGLACQGGTGIREHVDRYLDGLKYTYEERPKLVHRLDKDTSGVLLLSRTRTMAVKLQSMFKNHNSIRKTYWAFVDGHPPRLEGSIKTYLDKMVSAGEEKVVVRKENEGKAKLATARYQVLFGGQHGSLVGLYPRTGRTHQLRVMCASLLETPIVGDPKYGSHDGWKALYGGNIPLHLHARKLSFRHPDTQTDLSLIAPLPFHFKRIMKELAIKEETINDTLRIKYEDQDKKTKDVKKNLKKSNFKRKQK